MILFAKVRGCQDQTKSFLILVYLDQHLKIMEHMYLHMREIELVQDKAQMSNKIQIRDKIVKIIHKTDKFHLVSINILQKIRIKMFLPQLVEKVLINRG